MHNQFFEIQVNLPPTEAEISDDIADMLWLAFHIEQRGFVPRSLSLSQPTFQQSSLEPVDQPEEVDAELLPHGERKSQQVASSPGSIRPKTHAAYAGEVVGGVPFSAPAGPALPHPLALTRALRPILQRVPSPRNVVIDEQATVEQVAEQQIWNIALRPEYERWLALDLVIDEGSSMVVWRQTVEELRRLLERRGIFRDVRIWGLGTDHQEQFELRAGLNTSAWQPARSPRELINTAGRHLIIFVSDCVSPAWRSGKAIEELHAWSRQNPIVLIQVLPQRLWEGTALGMGHTAFLHTSGPGIPNQGYTTSLVRPLFGAPSPSGLILPVLSLHPHSIATWAQFVAGAGGVSIEGIAFHQMGTPSTLLQEEEEEQQSAPLTDQERIRYFRLAASPEAWQLIRYLSAVPLTLSVMRLVQHVMMPEPAQSQAHLAEAFLGGLMRRVEATDDPEHALYDFVTDGVRDLLQNTLTGAESILALRTALSVFVNEHVGQSFDFDAWLQTGTLGNVHIPRELQPFATVAATVLRKMGGRFAALAEELESVQISSETQTAPRQLGANHRSPPDEHYRVINVFVAAPHDVDNARTALNQVVSELNNMRGVIQGKVMFRVLDWKKHVTPWLGRRPEEIILDQIEIDTWDLFIGILWGRMGTPTRAINPVTGREYESGTEEEFELAYRRNQELHEPKMLLYRCTRQIRPDKIDARQLMLVQRFFEQFKRTGNKFGLFSEYRTITEFKQLVRRHLENVLYEYQEGNLLRPATSTDPDQRWLEAIGLTANPFQDRDAGRDTKLTRYVHDTMPYFQHLIAALRDAPRTMIVFGERGVGKSAMRKAIEHYSRTELRDRRVLTINYLDFSQFAEDIFSRTITLRDHIEHILSAGVWALARFVDKGRLVLDNRISEPSRRQLWKYIKIYGQNLTEPQYDILHGALVGSGPEPDSFNLPQNIADLFYGFCRAINIYGLDTVNILVDQVDEGQLGDLPEAMAALLAPLMRELQLMEPPHGIASFYFFLPAELEQPLKLRRVRFDRLPVIRPTWTDADLQQVIERRLMAFSGDRGRPFTRLAQLANDIPDLDMIFIRRAGLNPRTLITLCDYIIQSHLRFGLDDDNLLLTQADMQAALKLLDADQQDVMTADSASHNQSPPQVRTGETDMGPGVAARKVFNTKPLPAYKAEPTNQEGNRLPQSATVLRSPDKSQSQEVPAIAEHLPLSLEQIITVLPTPLSVALVRYLDEQDERERIWPAYNLAQLILQFGTSLLLALWKPYSLTNIELTGRLRTLLFTAGQPPTINNWREAMDRLLKALEKHDSPLCTPFAQLRATKDVWSSIQKLVERRNDLAHQRATPNDIRLQQDVINSADILIRGLSALEPIQLLTINGVEVSDDDTLMYRVGLHQGNIGMPKQRQVKVKGLYRTRRTLLHLPAQNVSVDLHPFILYKQPDNQATAQIYLYEQFSTQRGSAQIKYVSPVTLHVLQTEETLVSLRTLNLLSTSEI